VLRLVLKSIGLLCCSVIMRYIYYVVIYYNYVFVRIWNSVWSLQQSIARIQYLFRKNLTPRPWWQRFKMDHNMRMDHNYPQSFFITSKNSQNQTEWNHESYKPNWLYYYSRQKWKTLRVVFLYYKKPRKIVFLYKKASKSS
jgi:hypothetical protein